jgi:preprotein translocase YajC subunit
MSPDALNGFLPFIILIIGMYFFFIRPQVKKAKEQEELLKGITTGDIVLTHTGLIGRIVKITPQYYLIDLNPNSNSNSKSVSKDGHNVNATNTVWLVRSAVQRLLPAETLKDL